MKPRHLGIAALVVFLLALLGGVSWLFWTSFGQRPVALKTAEVKRGPLSQNIETSGELVPSTQVDVVAELSGRVVEFFVEAGDEVEAGQLLVRLDSTELELGLREAQARVDSEQANKDKIERILSEPPDPDGDADEESYSQEDLRIAQARLEEAKAALKIAQGHVERAQLKAPVAGRITEVNAVEGQVIAEGSRVATILDVTKLYFVGDVDETDISRVRSGQAARIVLDAFPDKRFRGEVFEVGQTPAANQAGGTLYDVKVKVTSAGASDLRSGLKGDAKIAVKKRTSTLTIPARAVVENGRKRVVYTIESGRLSRKVVKVGLTTDESYEITKGLEVGDVVVVDRISQLEEGDRVRPK